MQLCKCAFDPATAALIVAGVAAAGTATATTLQAKAAKKKSRLEQARAALTQRKETLKTVREAQALRAVASANAEAQGASDSSPLQGGLQGITSQAESNLTYLRSQGDLNNRVAKADRLSFLGSQIGGYSSLLGDFGGQATSKEGVRAIKSIFGT